MNVVLSSLAPLITEVSKVGQMLLDIWPGNPQRKNQNLKIEKKSDGSSVTSADYAANEMLQSALKRFYPQDEIISEESPLPVGQRPNSVWIIDPLDGTKSFIAGKDDFSILLAHVTNGVVDQAIMHFPALNVTAAAEKGKGAFIDGQTALVSTSTVLRESSIYVRKFKQKNPCFFTKRMDSGRAFLAVARGEFDGVIMGMGRHNEWDLAAPTLIIEEAGGRISDEHGQPIRFNQPEIYYKFFLASNTKLHPKLLQMANDT